MVTRWFVAALMAAVALLGSAPASAAEDVPFVDGNDWRKSAPVLKRAYLIGISNLMSAEYAYQQEFGPPPDDETTIPRLFEEIDDVSLDDAVDRIDAWYAKHPDQRDTTVLEVIWLDMVRPNLPASRRHHPNPPEGSR